MTVLMTLGTHDGLARRLARGARLTCRSYVPRWGEEYTDPVDAMGLIGSILNHARIDASVAVTWVPGHDGSLGPGYHVACAVARTWNAPLLETLNRRVPLPSAHTATVRPNVVATTASLVPLRNPWRKNVRLVVVDNVIASGASLVGALRVLAAEGYQQTDAFSITADLEAGCRDFLHEGPRGQLLHGPAAPYFRSFKVAVSNRLKLAAA